MGMSTKSQTSTVKPIYGSEIEGAAKNVSGAYNANAGKIQGYADQIGSMIPSLLDRAQNGDEATSAASGYITSTLSGDPTQNPYLDRMVGITNSSVSDKTRSGLGTRGLAGGTAIADILSRNLADNETGLRYGDYNNTMQRRAQAAGMAPGISASRSQSINDLLNTAGTAGMMPIQAANSAGAGISGLLGQYTNGVNKQNPSTADSIGKALQAFSSIASMFSDARLKTDVTRVGQTDGGLTVYTYRYGGGGPFQMGVMAQEVAKALPSALGPERSGYMTVNYGEVR